MDEENIFPLKEPKEVDNNPENESLKKRKTEMKLSKQKRKIMKVGQQKRKTMKMMKLQLQKRIAKENDAEISNSTEDESSIEILRTAPQSPASKCKRSSLSPVLVEKACPESKENEKEYCPHFEAKNSTLCENNALNIIEVPSPTNISSISESKLKKTPGALTSDELKIPKMISQPSKPVKKSLQFGKELLGDQDDAKLPDALVENMDFRDFCTPKASQGPVALSNRLKSCIKQAENLLIESNENCDNGTERQTKARKALLQYGKMTSTPVKSNSSDIQSLNVSEINSGSDGSDLLFHVSRVMISDSCPSYEKLESEEKSKKLTEENSTHLNKSVPLCCIAAIHDFPVLPCYVPTRKVFNLPPFLDYEKDILTIEF